MASLDDGFGNDMTDVDAKESQSSSWTDLNESNLIQIAQVPKLSVPVADPIITNYVFDVRATISSIMQRVGEYNGKLEFVVNMQY